MRVPISFLSRVLALTLSWPAASAVANDYLKPFTDTEDGTQQIQQAAPGQIIRIVNLSYGGYGNVDGSPMSGLNSDIHIESLSGATLFSEPAFADPISAFPYVVRKVPSTLNYGSFTPLFYLFAKVNPLDKQGHSAPVVLKASVDLSNSTGQGGTPPAVHETCTYVLPVSDIANLHVAVNVTTPTPGEVHPGQSISYQFTTDAAGADMDHLVFKAQVPKGTTLQTMYPADGKQVGNEITWKPSGSLSTFYAGFAAKVKSRPGTAKATTIYGGAAKVQSFVRTAQATSKTPITGTDNGKIDYYTSSGTGGGVVVDQTYTYVLSDWDWTVGDVKVTLDGDFVGTGSASVPYGSFTVPVFKDADLEEVITAQQTTHPVDKIVTGELDARAELIKGSVVMANSDSTIARKLKAGSKIATGEVVPTDTIFPDQLGHLRLDGATSGAVLAFAARPSIGSDGRLVFARSGDVAVYGGVRASKIKFSGPSTLAYSRQDLTIFDTSGKPGLLTLAATQSADLTVNGYAYRNGDYAITSNVTFNGAICFVTGNVTISGSLTGNGTLICLGNVTVLDPGKLQLHNSSSALVLGVGGTLEVKP